MTRSYLDGYAVASLGSSSEQRTRREEAEALDERLGEDIIIAGRTVERGAEA